MKKNQQGNSVRPSDKREKHQDATPATNKSQPNQSTRQIDSLLGFGQAVDVSMPAFGTSTQFPYATDNHHLTPIQGSHLSSSQSLSANGLPSPMGIGAAILPGFAPRKTSQIAVGQIVSGASLSGAVGGAGNSNQQQMSSGQIEQLGKELEGRAAMGDPIGVEEILASHHESIQKKTLNVALRAAVKGCNTTHLDDCIQCTQALIDAGANINSEEANEGKTALMMACEKGYLELVSHLLDHEALLHHKDQKKRTPLMYAIGTKAQNLDVVQELLNQGANVNECTLTGLTPLLLATQKQHTQIVRLLLKSDADITVRFPADLNTPLHYACIQGNMSTLKVLLEHCKNELMRNDEKTYGEFLYLLNKEDKTALKLAREQHEQDTSNEAFRQIFEELERVYTAYDSEIDNVVQTLLQTEEDMQVVSIQPSQSADSAATGGGGKSASSKRGRGGNLKKHASVSQEESGACQSSTNKKDIRSGSPVVVQQRPEEEKEAADSSVLQTQSSQGVMATKNASSGLKQQAQATVSKNKKNKKNPRKQSLEVVEASTLVMSQVKETGTAACAEMSDEDDFKSAESKTPPKESDENERAGSDVKGVSNFNKEEDTVTEHSSQEEQFFEARNSAFAESIEQATVSNNQPQPPQQQQPLTKAQKRQLKQQEQANLKKQESCLSGKQGTKKQNQQSQQQQQQQSSGKNSAVTQPTNQNSKKSKGNQQTETNSSATKTQATPQGKTKGNKRQSVANEDKQSHSGSKQESKTNNVGNSVGTKTQSTQKNKNNESESSKQPVLDLLHTRKTQPKQSTEAQQNSQQVKASAEKVQTSKFSRPCQDAPGQNLSLESSAFKLDLKVASSTVQSLKKKTLKEPQAHPSQPESHNPEASAQSMGDFQPVCGATDFIGGTEKQSSNTQETSQSSLQLQKRQSTVSQGAVQQVIINQQSWPQASSQLATSPKSSTSSNTHKQNAAVVENILQQPDSSYNTQDMENSEHPGSYRQRPNQPQPIGPFHQERSNPELESSNNQMTQAYSGGAASQAPTVPISLWKSLDTRKSQLDFILEQQDMRNKALTFQLYSHKERINEVEMAHNQSKQDHIVRVNEYYNQANCYYENFRQLESEMSVIAEQNQSQVTQGLQLVEQLKSSVEQDSKAEGIIEQLEDKLREIERNSHKFNDQSLFRKDDEKQYLHGQEAQSRMNEQQLQDGKNLQEELQAMGFHGASKQRMAKTQIQYSNLLVDMENAYGDESEQNRNMNQQKYPQQVFNKLHDEIILFDESVKSIMEEMEPIKKIIIDKISNFIKQVIPNGDVDVYGSHATKLCLHWSDIDLVLKPVIARESGGGVGRGGAGGGDQMYGNGRGADDSNYSGSMGGGYNMVNTRNWLGVLYSELIKSENRDWLQKVDFIENTTVPVIKLLCSFHNISQNANGQLLLPNGNTPRYPHIVSKPINVDITLWSETHNGPPCVSLVKSYLQESQLIEPLILVLKQMLKVWGFNDAYTGGLSSYALFLMIVSFLQEKRKPFLKSEVNMGETLLEFIRFYAQLDFSQYAICCKMPGEQSDKQNLYQNTNSEYNFFLQPRVVIDDPLNPSNNVGKSAFRFQEIKNIMCHAYNSVFTGCFCSCHFSSLCRNTSYHQNQGTSHQSQLLNNNSHLMLPQAPNSYLSYQYPPHFMQIGQEFNPDQRRYPHRNQDQPDDHSSAAAAAAHSSTSAQSNQAPYPAGSQNMMAPPSLRTQSQPFMLGNRGNASKPMGGAGEQGPLSGPNITGNNGSHEGGECSCDSIISRLIYGYNNYRRTMESLHPNVPSMSFGSSLGGSQPMIGAGFGMPQFGAMPFIGGQNM